jgi:putative tricarboxylic transport membrane protein
LLGFILGPMLEENLTRAMLIARGSVSIFYTRPLSLGLLVVAGALLFLMIVPAVRKKRAEVFAEEN